MKKKQEMIFKLQTKNWNKLTKKEQDEAILFMLQVLSSLSYGRKCGFSNDYFAQYP
jgi:hypothetical protein